MHLKNYIGDRSFYRKLVVLLVPLVLQQSISSVVNLLDNIMVGQLCQESLSAVAIVNQLIFVFNLSLFGAVSGASIFGAQYHGQGNAEGVRFSYRYRLWTGLILTMLGLVILIPAGDSLIRMFLNQDATSSGDLALTFSEAQDYLRITLWGLLPFAFSTALSSALRDTGETVTPMYASVLAILTNALLNFLLIFGHMGLPEMGVRGAALATVISRFVEALFLVVRSAMHRQRYPFLRGAYRSPYIPRQIVRSIFITGTPLLINELLWSLGTTMINQAYSVRGLDAVSATNICGTVWQIFSIIMMGMGSAIAILLGQQLGAGRIEDARTDSRRLTFVNLLAHLAMALIMVCFAPLIPRMYNVSPSVQRITEQLLLIAACALPFDATTHACYFTMRSGGKTLITFVFDCGFTWGVNLLTAFCLANYTSLSIVAIYALVQLGNVAKCIVGIFIVRSGIWLRSLTHQAE